MAVVHIAVRRIPTDNGATLATWLLWLVRPNPNDDDVSSEVSNDGNWLAEKELARGTFLNGRFLWHEVGHWFDPTQWAVLEDHG